MSMTIAGTLSCSTQIYADGTSPLSVPRGGGETLSRIGWGMLRRMTMTSHAADTLSEEEEEERYRELARAAEAGEFDHGVDVIEYLASQLPDGYVLDEHNHVIRTDPGLPDHFYIPALVNGVPSGMCRVPVRR